MANWYDTPDELAERQEDHAQDPDYDPEPYRQWRAGLLGEFCFMPLSKYLALTERPTETEAVSKTEPT